jgi:hypothetical protein
MRLLRRLAFLGAVVAFAVGAPDALATPVTFTDPTGDAGAAPDITTVVADGDTVQPNISLRITIVQADLTADQNIFVLVDVDQNAGTGGSGGYDVLIVLASTGVRDVPLERLDVRRGEHAERHGQPRAERLCGQRGES